MSEPRRSSPSATAAIARTTRGRAAIASAGEAPGRAATRSSGLTLGPRPPLEISTRRSTWSGNCQKNCIATPPPSEWPTIVASRTPSAASRSRIAAAWAPIE